jgi:hypothetical protein
MSSWIDWPLTSSVNIREWDVLIEPWFQMRKRHAIGGSWMWPPSNMAWNSGTIVSATLDTTAHTLTIDCGTVNWTPAGDSCDSDRWLGGCSACALCWVPGSYDFCIEPDLDDPLKTTRAPITGQTWAADSTGTGDGTLVVDSRPYENAVTAGFIPDCTSYLVGQTYYIMKSGTGLLSTERLPDKPTDPHEWTGTVSIGGYSTTTGNGYLDCFVQDDKTNPDPYDIADPPVSWAINQWVGHQALFFTNDGVLHRVDITANASTQLTFGTADSSSSSSHSSSSSSHPAGSSSSSASSSSSSGGSSSSSTSSSSSSSSGDGLPIIGPFLIVKPAHTGMPGRVITPIWSWYSGYPQGWWTHDPVSDGVTSTNLMGFSAPTSVATMPCPTPECDDTATIQTNDTDGQIDPQTTCDCGNAGNFVAPNYYKTWRALQHDIVGTANSFVDLTRKPLEYNTPTFLLALGDGDAYSTTGSFVDTGNMTVGSGPTGPGLTYPRGVTYVVADADGNFVGTNNGTLSTPTNLQGEFSSDQDGRAIVVGLGLVRWKPRRFAHMFSRTCIVPTYGDGGGVVYPPEVQFDSSGHAQCYVGIWKKLGPSTTYLEYGDDGRGFETAEPYIDGDLVRYVGDGDNAPGIIPNETTDNTPGLLPYFNHFYRGNFNKVNQTARDQSRIGSIHSGTANSFTDLSKDWWNDNLNVGVATTMTGTATGGSTTTLSDSTKDTTDDTQPWICWFDPGRFLGFTGTGPYCEFILEISTDGDFTEYDRAGGGGSETSSSSSSGVHKVWRVPVTGCTVGSGGVTFEFTAVTGLTVESGYSWRIREPSYEVNKWQTRSMSLHSPSGHNYTTTCTFSDDCTAWFDELVPVDGGSETIVTHGWTYLINEPKTGGVYKWDEDAGQWTVPNGADTARDGVTTPENFLVDQTANLENYVKDWGYVHKWDVFSGIMFDEIYRAINLLKATTMEPTWTDKSCETCDPVNNYGVGSAETYTPPTFAANLAAAQAAYVWGEMLDGTPPTSIGGCYYDGSYMVNLQGVFAWERLTGYTQIIPATIDFYAFSPKIPDFCFCSLAEVGEGCDGPVYPTCDNCNPDYPCVPVVGETTWTGGTVADLNYGMWTLLSSSDNSQPTAYSRSVGDQSPQLVIDPIATLGYEAITPGLGAGYTVTNQIAVLTWDFDAAYPPDSSLDYLRFPTSVSVSSPPPALAPAPRVQPAAPRVQRPCGNCSRAARHDGKK